MTANFKDWVKVSGDSGNDNTKLILKLEDETYKTVSLPTMVELSENKDGKNVAIYSSNRYIVGDETGYITDNQTDHDKANDIHKLSMITGLCNLLKNNGLEDTEKVLLTVNMPLNSFLNVDERSKTEKLYNERVSIKVNGTDFNFDLKVVLYFEGCGVINNHKNEIGEEPVITMMLGSFNTSAITFNENGMPIKNQSKSIEYGIIELIAKVQNALLPVVGRTYSDVVVKRIIKGKKDGVDSKVFDITKQVVIEHLVGVRNQLKRLGVELDVYKIIFAGGGAILLEKYLKEVFGDNIVIDNDPLFADAKGALKFIEKK